MAALRGKIVPGRLTTCFFKHTNAASISTLPASWTRNGYAVHRSHLRTIKGSGVSFVQPLLGRHNYGRLYLVSAMTVHQNNSKTTDGTVPATSSTADIPLSSPETAVESALVSAPETHTEAAQILASESVPVAAPLSDSALDTAPDLTPVITQPVTEVADAPVLAMDVLQGAGAELSLAELGLGCYTPVGLIQNLLEFMHVGIGLPWWGAIVAGTIIARCAVFPVIVKGQREAAKLNNVLPEMTKLTNRMNEAKQSGNKFEFSKAYSDMMLFQKKHDVNPLRGFLVPLVQAPVFISFFIALRKMAYAPVPSMQTGGLWWFTDLTAADPFYILPLAVTGTMFAILELGAESGIDNPNLRAMKTVFRIMPFIILPMTINFPTAVFTYWMTSNLFSLGQVALLRHPAVREKLKIPVRITHPTAALPPSDGFIENLRKGWKNAQLAHQLQERERRIKDHLDIAAKGPLRQTFSQNPLQQRSAPMSTENSSRNKQVQQGSGKKRPWEETIG
ncbi:mitochondrial inner membrane protein OXA1L [Tachysurus fulvidraco]|uniref:mitochondrial inner membrane protein OXA1L n=1 Tax=Tachysurus fulvidraco TaxID=1234273 RepID=UPI000F4F827F|nr:mitochondrial inner membrane protein OXA1L [Tachysurus fulvidraco]